MAKKKDEFLEKMKEQFDELNYRWNDERKRFEVRSQQFTENAKKRFEDEWKELSKMRRQMKEKIIDLEVAAENAWDGFKDETDNAWDDVKSGTEKAWKILSETFKKAASRYK